ncbi:hypothetical protein SK128_008581 [Halocaridina rubra]|uniref:Uncharacterized protein n=1 Tax=Halocaridina rubra TaxID=373956 RepID=A0AAN8WMN9_HALRR
MGEMGNESFNQANTTLPGYTYASRLELTDYDYQGYYYCHYNQTLDLTDENSFDDVYVYLFAYEENLVHTHQNINIKANESEEVILDCTPTKPELIVRVSFNGKVLHDGVLDEPRVGYKIPNITLGNKGVYTCAVNDDAINYTVEVSSRPSAPEVKMTSNYYPVLGYDMEITCIIIRRNSDPVFEWILPNPERIYEERVEEYRPNDMLYYQGFLKLKNATMMDSGNYTCKVQFPGYLTTQNTIDIQVQETKNSCIDVFPSDNGIVTCDEGANGTWLMTVDNFPPTLLHEFSHFFEGKVDGEKYTMQLFQNGTCLLEMLGVRITDTGKYILNLTTLDGVASFLVELELRVRGKPRLNLTGVEDILEAYKVIEAKCIETGYPLEDIHWSYHSCSEGVCEEDSQILNGSLDVEVNSRSKEYMQVSTTVFNVTELAKLRCQAGNASVEIPIRILDIEKPYVFKYTLDNDSKEIPSTAEHNFVETDFINLYCGASKYDYSNLTIDPPIANKDSKGRSINIIDDSTKYSFIKKIVLENATKDLSGKYECNALYRNSSSIQTNTLTLNITDLHPVHFSLESNMKTRDYTIPKIAKESFKFLCLVHGTKPISIIWTKDGQPLPKNFTFADETNQIIEINDLSSDIHDGRYACTASNRKGKYHVTGFLTLVVSGERYSASTKVILSIVLAGIGFLLLVVFVLCRRVRRDVLRRRIERKNAAYLFERGRPNELNPDCSADEQAELLPYDKKCEVSRDRITFGQQLGSGAFGRVIKAMVSNVEPGKESTIVAVKMCKSQADISQVRALTLELKIMLHIGKHLNIVNLLGANTARIDKGNSVWTIFSPWR